MAWKGYDKRGWDEFRATGLLTFVNTFLHIFGWCIVVVMDDNDTVVSVYPARTEYRGFPEKSMSRAYKKLTAAMSGDIKELQAHVADIPDGENS